MIGNPYATPLPGSPDYQKKPAASGIPTQYQDTPPKHWDGIGTSGGGDKFPLPGDAPAGMPGGEVPGAQDQPKRYAGMPDLGWMLQQRKASDAQRRLLAQILARQQQPQGPAPYANSPHPIDLPPPVAQASPGPSPRQPSKGWRRASRKAKPGSRPRKAPMAGGAATGG